MIWVLVVVLITPAGRQVEVRYPPVTHAQCLVDLKTDTNADPKGYKIVSAKCERSK